MKLSRVARQKKEQGWRKRGPNCGNCAYFRSEIENKKSIYGGNWLEEKNKRCVFGDFATGKIAWCEGHKFQEDEG